jgi:hypothetical protein
VSDDTRRPIADVLPGFTIHPLEVGWTPLQAFVLIKSLDDSGDASWSYRTSEQLNLEELLGALTVQVELLRRSLISEWDTNERE